MNPEFQRNVWLELTARRIVLMVVVLALCFFAAALSDKSAGGTGATARWLYYLIVVAWGSRNAALSVVGEIRERTWDGQRLSSLDAGTMMWGKLFGATIYNWFGGAICLAVVMADLVRTGGPAVALIDLVYLLAVGVIAQAVSLLVSLLAARRRHGRSGLEIFLYQAAGIAAAAGVYTIWSMADPAGSILVYRAPTDFIVWWGRALDARAFLLLSLAIFTGWTLVGCYREMRLELKLRNLPYVWLGFLAFIGIYVAGFDAWLGQNTLLTHLDAVALRLLLAGSAFAVLAYLMVFLEPKDRVHLRWLASAFVHFRLRSAFGGLQAWMMAWLAALAVGIVLVMWLGQLPAPSGQAMVGAMLGFLTRDMAIVVLANAIARQRGGDFVAIATLFALYVLLPAIVNGLSYGSALVLFFPQASAPVWLSPAVAWGEALLAVVFAVSRVALSDRKQPA